MLNTSLLTRPRPDQVLGCGKWANMHLMLITHNCTDYSLFQKHTKKVPVPQVEEETILPFPEQSISQFDKSLCYIYPTKAADDILTAACCRHTAHAPANHAAGRGEGEQELYQGEESTETFVCGEDNIETWK